LPTNKELESHINELLEIDRFKDYAPNGLQIEGRKTINKIITGVTACKELLEMAVESQADAVIVHHGYFWKGEDPRIIGLARERIALLLKHDINLLAYHLPLDADPKLGNNIQLAKRLGLTIKNKIDVDTNPGLLCVGQLSQAQTPEQFIARVGKEYSRTPLHIPGKAKEIKHVAWCTGAAQDLIQLAAQQGIDTYITGEASERTYHYAKESGIHFIAAGHHATERDGIQALGEHLAKHFNIECNFKDIHNPI